MQNPDYDVKCADVCKFDPLAVQGSLHVELYIANLMHLLLSTESTQFMSK